ncbi:hypothetical protein A0K93_05855 [Corynebacterium sp. BCW_4722]|nr:hypothetical protein A0K93_05855 [Corynebacterium sp. BCW_4722]
MRQNVKNLFDGMEVGPSNSLWPVNELPQGLNTVRVSGSFHMLSKERRENSQIAASARAHPRGVRYEATALCRATAFGIENPEMVVLGFGALALYGLPFFADATDTVLMDPTCRRYQCASAEQPAIVRRGCNPRQVWSLKHCAWPLQAADPPTALVQALKLVQSSNVTWPVIELEGFDAPTIRGIQLVDAARRFLGIDLAEVLRNSDKVLNQRWVTRVIACSSRFADSPRETEMRLLLSAVAEKHDLTLREQVPVHKDGKIVTTLDFAFIEPQIGAMYDGGHHGDPTQWEADSGINLVLTSLQWCLLRFTRKTFLDAPAAVDEKITQWRRGSSA